MKLLELLPNNDIIERALSIVPSPPLGSPGSAPVIPLRPEVSLVIPGIPLVNLDVAPNIFPISTPPILIPAIEEISPEANDEI